MFTQIILVLGILSFVAAVVMTVVGVGALVAQRTGRKNTQTQKTFVQTPIIPQTPSVVLEGKGALELEQGVLLNTLWEHLPNAECQSGECGGCKVRLISGQVNWIREPVVEFNRDTHVLACSCEPVGRVHVALDVATN